MNYEALAATILHKVGGAENVTNVNHCATRLRFNLKDESKADTEGLKKTPGVLGVASKNGQYQIIIGEDVPLVYRELAKSLPTADSKHAEAKEEKKGKWYERLIDTLTGIFTPILPALTASGMLKAVLAVLIAFGLVDKTSMTYQVLNFMGDATFYFLPVMLGASAAKKFGCNMYLGIMLGAILIHPNFVSLVTAAKEGGEAVSIFGIPIYNATYSSTVIPILLGMWLMSYVEPWAEKHSPKAIKFFTAPLITMFVCGIATLCFLGPIGYIVGNWLAAGITSLSDVAPWLVPTIIGAFLPFLVMTGTHHALTPIGINNRMTIGYDTVIYPGQLASNVAQGAAALAMAVKTKNSTQKQLASSTGITAVCGITEPVLFGVTMSHKTNMIASMIGGGVGGFFLGAFNVKNYSGGSPGLLTLPSYIGLDAPMSNFYLACAGAAIAFVVAFVVNFILYKDPVEAQAEGTAAQMPVEEAMHTPKNVTLYALGKGACVPLKEVPDDTFAQEIIGKGVAFKLSEGRVYAPANGTIKTVFPTKHAITMTTDDGVDLIIHVGIDTVKLEGKYFTAHVKDGDVVEQGDLLLEFDQEAIAKEGYATITPLVVADSNKYAKIEPFYSEAVKPGDKVLQVEG